jgi:tripartite ATP-independent transporter DctM subunit
MGQLFGPIRGGLAYSVILVGALLGAITGTVAASVIAMGLISLPVMTRYGYDPKVATGVIAASGTITQIIPPSLVLVVLADAMGRSVGDMYAGAFIPSFILVGLFCLWIFIVGIVWPDKVPPLPKEVRTASLGVLFVRCMVSMVPSLVLIFMVLGTILMGLATPTEGGAMGAVGALALAIMHRRLTWKLLKEGMDTTLKLTTMVMFILIGSTVFSLTFRGVDGDLWIEGMLSNLPGGVFGFLVFVNVFVFFLAFFLDYFEIAFIIIPLLAPVAEKMGIDLIHRREHADVVHASAVRLCAVLPALDRTALNQERRHPLGLDPLGHHHADHGGAGDPVSGHGVAQHPDLRQVLGHRQWLCPLIGGEGVPAASTAYSTSTLPAFANSSVALTFWPFSSGCFSPVSITWNDPGLSSTVSPGLISSPPSTGRILATPCSITMLWTSNPLAAAVEPPTRRSGTVPLLVMVM